MYVRNVRTICIPKISAMLKLRSLRFVHYGMDLSTKKKYPLDTVAEIIYTKTG